MLPSRSKFNFFLYIFLLSFVLAACSRQPESTADVPRLLPKSYRISVAPFTQPLNASQLITGHIPENQGKINLDELETLDMELREILMNDTNRTFNFIKRQNLPKDWSIAHSSEQPGSAIIRWLDYARKNDAQYLLIPQVLNWREREGSQAGVTKSAFVRVEFFLINVEKGIPVNRSIFEEEQVGLSENLLSMGDFFKRKGQWVSARELALDGMKKAVRDLGL